MIINKAQEEILRSFSDVPDSEHFYLTGGTALAFFYLGHRRSVDLDFFTTEEGIVVPFSRALEEFLKQKGFLVECRRTLRSFSELFVTVHEESTLIHLAVDSPFRLESTRECTEFPGLKVDPFKDIACNKLLALFGRAALRDFIDVYFLINKGHFTKEQLVEWAYKKDAGFDLYWLGVAFSQIQEFKQAALEDMAMLVEPVKFEDIALFFNQWRSEIIKMLP